MKQIVKTLLIGFLFVSVISQAENYLPQNVSPTGALDWSVYEYLDDLGDIIRTIPIAAPAAGNAFVGSAWANGNLILFENVSATTSAQFKVIDPNNGNVLQTVPLPITGYVMGAAYDGTGIWVAKWYTTNVIYKVDLAGNLMQQFTPQTGSYSCRAVNYQGGFLWVGANAGSGNDTKLYKMSLTGTILEEYNTSTQVGWYMGSEFDTNAPGTTALFVADNIGNTIKRLSISGGVVTVVDQFSSPVAVGDYAEGLTFDGEYLWHNSALSMSNVIWCLDDGIASTPLDMTVTLTPVGLPIQIPAGGGSFNFNIEVSNNENASYNVDVWTMAELPNGSMYGPIVNVNTTLSAGFTGNRDRIQNVPANAPTGDYVYRGYVGVYPSTIYDEDQFNFEKLATDDGSAVVSDWLNWGESFDDLSGIAGTLNPDEYSISPAYPNPFNPETKLAFSLKESGQVSLKVYNIMGEEVASLIDGYMNSGVHEVVFNGANLSSGIYLYSINAGDFHAVKKMMLLK